MDIAKSKKMVFIGDSTFNGENRVICPYCGCENLFSRNRYGEPKVVKKCVHFTSIFMEAIPEPEPDIKYNHYARFIEL